MTTYLIGAGVLVLVALPVSIVVGNRQMRRILSEFDAESGVDMEPLPEPLPEAASTLPVSDEDGWSARSGFNPWAVWLGCREVSTDADAWRLWMDARRGAADDAFAAHVLADLDSSPILAELATRKPVLAIEPAPRELEGATK